MKHGSITSHLRRRNSQNNELKGKNPLQRRRRQFHLLIRSWHQFFRMHVVYFHWLSSKRKNNKRQALCELITAFEWWNQEKTAAFGKMKMLFHQDNVPVHTSVIAMAKINELKFKLLLHVPYSPDLAPSDYFLFPNLKKWLGDQRFANNEEVKSAVNGYFEELDGSPYKQGIEAGLVYCSWRGLCLTIK